MDTIQAMGRIRREGTTTIPELRITGPTDEVGRMVGDGVLVYNKPMKFYSFYNYSNNMKFNSIIKNESRTIHTHEDKRNTYDPQCFLRVPVKIMYVDYYRELPQTIIQYMHHCDVTNLVSEGYINRNFWKLPLRVLTLISSQESDFSFMRKCAIHELEIHSFMSFKIPVKEWPLNYLSAPQSINEDMNTIFNLEGVRYFEGLAHSVHTRNELIKATHDGMRCYEVTLWVRQINSHLMLFLNGTDVRIFNISDSDDRVKSVIDYNIKNLLSKSNIEEVNMPMFDMRFLSYLPKLRKLIISGSDDGNMDPLAGPGAGTGWSVIKGLEITTLDISGLDNPEIYGFNFDNVPATVTTIIYGDHEHYIDWDAYDEWPRCGQVKMIGAPRDHAATTEV